MKNLTTLFLSICLFGITLNLSAQVGINIDGSQPDPSAGLDVRFANKGLLPPRVQLVNVNSPNPISFPAIGLLVYNTVNSGTPPNNVIPGFYYWNGIKWVSLETPQGVNIGDILYWNGTSWISLPIGLNGQILAVMNGIPSWIVPQPSFQIPTLLTTPISGITAVSATSGGNVSDGGSPVTAKGVCWSTTSNPTTANNRSIESGGAGIFSSNLLGLNASTLYFVRAYATNSAGTGYGNETCFTTQNGLISLTTMDASSITAVSALSGGTIINDGGAAVLARGLCWSTNNNPTILGNHTIDGTGTGVYFSNLTGLNASTLYFVRAYATNSVGTVYGNEVSFTTQNGLINLTTTQATLVSANSALSGGNILSNGGASIIVKGVCWSTSHDPLISDNKTIDGLGMGAFISNLTGLLLNTTYFVRAYATNSVGTCYGNEISFTTQNGIIVLSTASISSITSNSAISGGIMINDGGLNVINKGVCWSTLQNPAIFDNKSDDGPGSGNYISNISGLSLNTTYFVRAYATNSQGTFYGNEISFTSSPFVIGQSYGGGIIFYIDGTGQHGLIAAPSDLGYCEWGCMGTLIGTTSLSIGSGQSNTTAIINGCNTSGTAARICDELVLNGYTDWFLPSEDELYQMYLHQNAIGGFQMITYYWSSTEFNADDAYMKRMDVGAPGYYHKDYTSAKIRAIRAF